MYVCIDVSIMIQIINRVVEGIAATNGAGRSKHGTLDLHRPIWIIKKHATKKVARGRPTLSPWSPNPISSPQKIILKGNRLVVRVTPYIY